MTKGLVIKAGLFAALVLSAAGDLYSQEAVLLKTKQGFVQLKAWSCSSWGCSTTISSSTCASDGCSLTRSYKIDYDGATSVGHQAELAAQQFSVSASHKYKDTTRNGASESDYSMDLYAQVVPNANLRVKLDADAFLVWKSSPICGGAQVSANASVNFTNTPYGGGVSVSSGIARGGIEGEDSGHLTVIVSTTAFPQSPVAVGEDLYYRVGQINLSGQLGVNACWFWGGSSYAAEAGFNANVKGVDVRYVGKVLKKADVENGDNQTWLVGKKLPQALSVKVVEGISGALVPGIPITFSVQSPDNGAKFSNGQTSITVETDLGISSVTLTLGVSSGTYKVTASCPPGVCVPGVDKVEFTENARFLEQGRQLQWNIPELYGALKQKLSPFRVRVYNSITKEYEKDITMLFKWLSFTNASGVTTPCSSAPNGATLTGVSSKSSPEGYGSAYLTLGEKEGVYTLEAVCDSCWAQKEVILRGYAEVKETAAVPESIGSANPDARDPDTGEPATPVLGIVAINTKNDNQSFTTDPNENLVQFEAKLLPESLDASGITWEITDAPDDFINSGELPATKTGLKTEVYVKLPQVPAAPTGRPLPLSYIVRAKAIVNGKPVYSRPWPLKQDEIDKCRQEYLDYVLEKGKLVFSDVPRSTFTFGVASEFAINPYDCYAYINPIRAGEVLALREWAKINHPDLTITVTSGYRSPRKNIGGLVDKASPTSWHMYGKAVDITLNSNEYKKLLWEKTDEPRINFPKMLEKSGPVIVVKYVSESGLTELANYVVKPTVDLNKNKIPDREEDADKNGVPDTLEGMTWEQLKPYLIVSDGIEEAISSAGWIHLGR